MHKLIIKSLHDAQAECPCGWHYIYTGERTKQEIEHEYAKHLPKTETQSAPKKPTYKELLKAVIEAHTEIGEFLVAYDIEDDLDHAPRKLHNKLWDLIQRDKNAKGV